MPDGFGCPAGSKRLGEREMSLMDDLNSYVDYCYDIMTEMKNTKSGEYKMGIADGMQDALFMLFDYLEDYPDFIDPRHKYDKFKK